MTRIHGKPKADHKSLFRKVPQKNRAACELLLDLAFNNTETSPVSYQVNCISGIALEM